MFSMFSDPNARNVFVEWEREATALVARYLGELELRHVVLQVADEPEQKLVPFAPADEDQARIAELVRPERSPLNHSAGRGRRPRATSRTTLPVDSRVSTRRWASAASSRAKTWRTSSATAPLATKSNASALIVRSRAG